MHVFCTFIDNIWQYRRVSTKSVGDQLYINIVHKVTEAQAEVHSGPALLEWPYATVAKFLYLS